MLIFPPDWTFGLAAAADSGGNVTTTTAELFCNHSR